MKRPDALCSRTGSTLWRQTIYLIICGSKYARFILESDGEEEANEGDEYEASGSD